MFKVTIDTGKISKEHAKTLAKMDKLCFTDEAWTIKDWISQTNDNFQIIWIKSDENVIGALAWGWFPVPKTGYLYSFAVRPDHRGLGFGRQLIDAFIWQADFVFDISTLFAHTRTSNTSSQKLLIANNFHVNSYVNFYYDSEDAFEWKRQPSL